MELAGGLATADSTANANMNARSLWDPQGNSENLSDKWPIVEADRMHSNAAHPRGPIGIFPRAGVLPMIAPGDRPETPPAATSSTDATRPT